MHNDMTNDVYCNCIIIFLKAAND